MEEEIRKVFTELVQFTKEVSPEVWRIMLKQQLIRFISCTVCLLASLAGSLFGCWILKNRPKWAICDMDENIWGWIVTLVFGVAFLTCFGLFVADSLPRLLNPEYYVLMDLKP